MESTRDIVTLGLLFVSLYFEVFMLITYLDRRHSLRRPFSAADVKVADLPTVTIVVPCFNEQHTVGRTIDSLLALDYPADKLFISAVNDGSTDGTAQALLAYAHHPQVTVINKENGGKHTALNLAIRQSHSEFVGCLDADSYAEKDALLRIMKRFDLPEIMAVVPALHVYKASTIIQRLQKVEYLVGVFLRSILAELNSIYVTPGPFSIFRKSVFEKIGYYKKAHNTEDTEMALRMQANGMRIASAHDAVIYTSSPRTVKTLYKQRVRWTSGFLSNVRDYRFMIFRSRYGYLGSIVLPIMLASVACVLVAIGLALYDFAMTAYSWYQHWNALGLRAFEWSWPSFDWFYVHLTPLTMIGYVAIAIVIATIFLGTRLSRGNRPQLTDLACYGIVYSFIAPFWLVRSLANVAFRRQAAWR